MLDAVGQSRHHHRTIPGHDVAIPELSFDPLAPAPHRTFRSQGTGVQKPRLHLYHRGQVHDHGRSVSSLKRSIPELGLGIRTKAAHRAGSIKHAGVVGADGHGLGRGRQVGHHDRGGHDGLRLVHSELPVRVVAEASDRTRAHHGTRVVVQRRDASHPGVESAHRPRDVPFDIGSVAELAQGVVSPAPHRTRIGQGTGVQEASGHFHGCPGQSLDHDRQRMVIGTIVTELPFAVISETAQCEVGVRGTRVGRPGGQDRHRCLHDLRNVRNRLGIRNVRAGDVNHHICRGHHCIRIRRGQRIRSNV